MKGNPSCCDYTSEVCCYDFFSCMMDGLVGRECGVVLLGEGHHVNKCKWLIGSAAEMEAVMFAS